MGGDELKIGSRGGVVVYLESGEEVVRELPRWLV